MLKYLLTCLFFLFGTSVSYAQDYAAERAEAERLGAMLYAYDNAAWGATDGLMADAKAKARFLVAPIGYVTTENGDGTFTTAFIGKTDDGPKAVVDVITRDRSSLSVITHETGRTLGGQESLLVAAKGAAGRENFESCADFLPMNSIAIPAPDGQIYVYFMSATQDPDLTIFGRHYRFRVDRNTVTETVSFTNTCLGMPRPENGVFAVVSHVKTPYPQEHHVFANLSYDVSIYVTIYVTIPETEVLWQVRNGRITKVKQD
jgi:hypothetical protein